MNSIRPDMIWAMSFWFDATVDARGQEMLNVIDKFSCECMTIEIDRSFAVDSVVAIVGLVAARCAVH